MFPLYETMSGWGSFVKSCLTLVFLGFLNQPTHTSDGQRWTNGSHWEPAPIWPLEHWQLHLTIIFRGVTNAEKSEIFLWYLPLPPCTKPPSYTWNCVKWPRRLIYSLNKVTLGVLLSRHNYPSTDRLVPGLGLQVRPSLKEWPALIQSVRDNWQTYYMAG